MATPKPGEIRCPTCHRSTAPAAFCTQCGSAIPSDARIRPRGMDRDELQDRIRARRSGADPYRRGGMADEGTGGYQRFEPEPDDARARRSRGADERRRDALDEAAAARAAAAAGTGAATSSDRPDITREHDDWMGRSSAAKPPPPPAQAAAAAPTPDEPVQVDNYDETAYDDAAYPYEYDDWDDDQGRRSSGAGAFAILGFLALGVLALVGGAVLAGVFNGEPGTGSVDATPTPSASIAGSLAPSGGVSAAPSASGSAAATGEPPASGDPVVFPDGFTAEAQPCLPGSADLDGCESNGAANAGAVDMWIGFQNGNADDVLGVTLIGPDGSTISDGSLELADIGCVAPCGGYSRFPFSGLGPGRYQVEVTRNGERAASTSFEVT